MKLRIVVADDNPEFLDVVVSILRIEFEVVATAADGKAALKCICRHRPDVAVLDLTMPALNGLDVTKEVAKHSAGPAVVICSVETDLEIVEAAGGGSARLCFQNTRHGRLSSGREIGRGGQSFVSPG
jgi:CheY-like chemotaxis protein